MKKRLIVMIKLKWLLANFTLVTFVLFCTLDCSTAAAANRALLVGVEKSPNQRALKGVRNDVGVLRKTLITSGFFKANEIMILLDQEATKAKIMASFKRWLIQGSSSSETILFYFSGHGAQIWEHQTEQTAGGIDQALMCADSKAYGPAIKKTVRGRLGEAFEPHKTRNFLTDYEIEEMLRLAAGRTVIFICDSCFSGTVYGRVDPFFVQGKALDLKPVGYKSVFDDRISTPQIKAVKLRSSAMIGGSFIPNVSLAAFTASQENQVAEEKDFIVYPKGWHGVFTWSLVRALSGGVQASDEGNITFQSLANFLASEIKRTGYPQSPQALFSPKTMADQPMIRVPPAINQTTGGISPSVQPLIVRPDRLPCWIEKGPGITDDDLWQFRSKLLRILPFVVLADKKEEVVCKISLEKASGVYGARLSDLSGYYWETNKGLDLIGVTSRLAGNLKAYYIQRTLAELTNPNGKRKIQINIRVRGPERRSEGEAVQGDSVIFESETKTGGYPYIFSVDASGVIHPLFPVSKTEIRPLLPGDRGFLGPENSFEVAEPFGKEMIHALIVERPLYSMISFWAQDHIGMLDEDTFDAQKSFLDNLWKELVASERPKGEWTSMSWIIRSFRQ